MSDYKMAGAVSGNVILAVAGKVGATIVPSLATLIGVGQFLVAVGTIVWICFRIRGARLDNKIKEKQLADADKKE